MPAVVEVKVVNMGLSPSLSASQWEGLSTMGYRHTEPFAKSARQREMFGSGLGGKYNIQIEEVQIEIYISSFSTSRESAHVHQSRLAKVQSNSLQRSC